MRLAKTKVWYLAGWAPFLLGLAAPAAAACAIEDLTNESGRVVCAAGIAGTRAVRLEVVIGGFHDDSRVSMSVSVGGVEALCAAGDVLELSGDAGDIGDVVLTCRLGQTDGRTVSARLRLHHAYFVEARLLSE
jgi:hypothetical protein